MLRRFIAALLLPLLLLCAHHADARTIFGRPAPLFAISGANSSHTGDTNETALATVTIPANSLGANGQLRITALWAASGTNTKTVRIRFHGAAGVQFINRALTTQVSWMTFTIIQNRNATNSQIGTNEGPNNSFAQNTSANVTASVDTTLARDIVFTCQLTNTGESCGLVSYSVEVLYAP